jgi:hypothetical protein
MTNREHFDRLDPELKELFKEAIESQRINGLARYLDEPEDRPLLRFYSGAFRWGDTRQGRDFWADLSNGTPFGTPLELENVFKL